MLTNPGRQHNSEETSLQNKKNITSFVQFGGWSDDFPSVVGDMSGTWYFTHDPDLRPEGCTAEEYVARANRQRENLEINIRGDKTKNGPLLIEAFERMYCDETGTRRVLTVENMVWVHSGHQRTQFTLFNAFVESLRQQADSSVNPKPPEYSLLVPCNVKEFDSLDEILRDQMSMNMSAEIHNPLDVLDLTKAARQAIGRAEYPLLAEREFRKWCAEPGTTSEDGGNDGGYPRYAYLLALINYFYRGTLGFYNSIVAPEKVPHPTIKEGVANKEFIDYREVAVKSKDPMSDASVIARLMEPGLDKLTKYASRFGPDSKHVAKGGTSKLSAIEVEILRRGYCWTEEEASDWVNSKKKFAETGYVKPDVPEKVEPFKVDKLVAIVNSSEPSTLVRKLLAELVNVVVPVAGPPGPVPTGVLAKTTKLRNVLDVLDVLNVEDDEDATFLQLIEEIGQLRDASSVEYSKLLGQLLTATDEATKRVASTLAKASVEGTTTSANGDVVVPVETQSEPEAVVEADQPKVKAKKSKN